jgi:hypothetical protein
LHGAGRMGAFGVAEWLWFAIVAGMSCRLLRECSDHRLRFGDWVARFVGVDLLGGIQGVDRMRGGHRAGWQHDGLETGQVTPPRCDSAKAGYQTVVRGRASGPWLVGCLAGLLSAVGMSGVAAPGPALSLHPGNRHYFEFRGRPTVVVTSGEHYGAVLNLDFDFGRYLETLERDGLNGTRTFAGAYCEAPGAFRISRNTLAPKTGRFICPWARSEVPGYGNGGNKFDLSRWDEGYFRRLKDFMGEAARRGVIVELNLFCPFYQDTMWKLSPINAINNVNGAGAVARTNVYTLDRNGGLLRFQEEMTRKIVRELKDFENLYYEVCNEPYFGGVTMEWQHRMVDVIVATEKELGVRHLISQNIANGKAKVKRSHPEVSIFNFHYASPPHTVGMNYGLQRVIGDNETGFRGTNDAPYRMEAWDFVVAGGALFNHLDYSFVAGHEDGSFVYPASQPGGGNAVFRKQMRILRQTIDGFNFVRMHPAPEVVKGSLPEGVSARALCETGKDYLLYVRSGLGAKKDKPRKTNFAAREVKFGVDVPKGVYQVEWVNTKSGKVNSVERVEHAGGVWEFGVPAFEEDVAGRVRRGGDQ